MNSLVITYDMPTWSVCQLHWASLIAKSNYDVFLSWPSFENIYYPDHLVGAMSDVPIAPISCSIRQVSSWFLNRSTFLKAIKHFVRSPALSNLWRPSLSFPSSSDLLFSRFSFLIPLFWIEGDDFYSRKGESNQGTGHDQWLRGRVLTIVATVLGLWSCSDKERRGGNRGKRERGEESGN